MAVRTAPQNTTRDKTDKKAVGPASLYQFERFLRFGLSFRILPFRFAPPYSYQGESTALMRYSAGPIRAETLLLVCQWKGFLL